MRSKKLKTSGHCSAVTNGSQTETETVANGVQSECRLDYTPKLCLRCHCKQNDPFDNSTAIWCAAFQPQTSGQKDGNRFVATCGANMVCIVDCLQSVHRSDKSVIARYIDNHSDEEFVSLAWSPVDTDSSENLVLAVGGKKSIVLMSNQNDFHCFERVDAHSDQINALVFVAKDLLFSGSYDKCVKLWRISRPDDKSSTQMLKMIDTKHYLLSLSFSVRYQTLLASGGKGVFFWCQPLSDSPDSALMKTKLLVDGLQVMANDEDSVAIRIQSTKHITIIDLKKAMDTIQEQSQTNSDTKSLLLSKLMKAKLQSFDFDYPFIYLSTQKNLLLSGGPNGQVWAYDSERFRQLYGTNGVYKVDRIFEWPLVENIEKDNKLVIDDEKPVIVNTVAISADLKFLVACTSMNLICIWQRTPDNSS